MDISFICCPFQIIRLVVLWVEINVVYHILLSRFVVLHKSYGNKPMYISLNTTAIPEVNIQIAVVVCLRFKDFTGSVIAT